MTSVPTCTRPPRGVKLQKPRPLKSVSEMVRISEIVKENLSQSFCQDIMEEEIQEKDILLCNSIVKKNDNGIKKSCYTGTVGVKSVNNCGDGNDIMTGDDNNNEISSSDCEKKNEISMKTRRAPRSAKLDKPRPLKSASLKTGNPSKQINVTEMEVHSIIEKLRNDTLTVQDTQQLVLFFKEHGSEMEKTNKELVDYTFSVLQESLSSKNLDKLSFLSLVDLVALRNRNWETYYPTREMKRVSWKDIEDVTNEEAYDEISSNHSDDVFGRTPSYDTQQSMDSGFGEMEDEILWEDEESFLKELEKELTGSSLSEHENTLLPVIDNVDKSSTEVLEAFKNVCVTESTNRERIKFSRQSSLTKTVTQCVPVIRDPLGPGSSSDLILKVEKTMPSGRFTPKDSKAGKPYEVEKLLNFSQSPLSKQQPEGWSYLVKIYPDICLVQADTFFDKKEFVEKRKQQIANGKLVRQIKNNDQNENSNNRFDNAGGILRSFSCGFEMDSSAVADFTVKEKSKDMLKRRHSFGFGTPEKGSFNYRERKSSGGFGTPENASARNNIECDNISVLRNQHGFSTPVKCDNEHSEEKVFFRNSGGFGTPESKSTRNSMERDIFSTARNGSCFGTPVKNDHDNESDDGKSIRRMSGGFGSPHTKNFSQ